MKTRIIRLLIAAVGLAVGGLLLIQLVPYGRDHSNPPVVSEPVWGTAEARAIAVRACYDCHSNEVDWSPFYTSVAPASWLVQRDVEHGREHLNFSDWERSSRREGAAETIEEIHEVLNEGEMPPLQYTLVHPEARLSSAEIQILVDGLRTAGR